MFNFSSRQWLPSERTSLLFLAVAVGLCSGIGIWLFTHTIEFLHEHVEAEIVQGLNGFQRAAAIIMTLGITGLVVGWIKQTFVGHERHHGVAGIIEAVALAGGRLRYTRMPFKAVASALSIGMGASVGPEDPSVQIGANIGSFFGQILRFSEDRVRLLVAAGSASAISAAFNAPIAGVFFALEVILGEFTTSSFGVVVLSSVVASVFMKAVDVHGPELGIHEYNLGGPAEIPFYILLGIIAAPISVAFMRLGYWQQDLWHRLQVPQPIRTALAGMAVGVIAIFFPEIMGTGRATMNTILNAGGTADFGIALLLALVVFKILATNISQGGGFIGGIFAPSLFVGVTLGGAFGSIIEKLFPDLNLGHPEAYAIAGMGAVMAGVVRAPITAVILIFELTDDYQLILPIMLTTVICVAIAERFEQDGVYSLSLRRKGVHIRHGRDIDVMQSVTVQEAMISPAPSIAPEANLTQLRDTFRREQSKALCVVEDGRLLGLVAMSDLQRAYESANASALQVQDIMTKTMITITPDEPAWTAIQRMGVRDIGSIPVVSENDTEQVIGLLRRHDIMRVYNIAIARKWEAQYQEHQIRLNTLTNERVIEVQLKPKSVLVGQEIQAIKWPRECVVASIRRGRKIILPHGNTKLASGDILIVVIEPDYETQLRSMLEETTQD